MPDLEKVIKGLECCYQENRGPQCDHCPYKDECEADAEHLMRDALSLLKAQEQEINRLKHHIDCDAAEKIPSGCVGYGRGFNDDEPCETCKKCEKYNGYGEE